MQCPPNVLGLSAYYLVVLDVIVSMHNLSVGTPCKIKLAWINSWQICSAQSEIKCQWHPTDYCLLCYCSLTLGSGLAQTQLRQGAAVAWLSLEFNTGRGRWNVHILVRIRALHYYTAWAYGGGMNKAGICTLRHMSKVREAALLGCCLPSRRTCLTAAGNWFD